MKRPRILKCLRIAALGAVVVSVACAAVAQESPRQQRADRARTFLVLRIAEELDLSDEKALKISHIFEAASERREALRGERQALAEPLEAAIATGEESAITELVAKAREIDRKLLLVVADSFEEVDSVLTVVERGKLALLVPQIQDQLRRGGRRSLRDGGRRGEPARRQ